LWGKQLSGENILFYCANIATVQIIKNGRSKEPLINEIYETSDCARAMLNNYLLFLVMRFAMNEPISSSEFPRKK
jgi:hypothetical protein